MEIEVDYNPSPSKTFFVSISLNDKEAISFDNTVKGARIIKQILAENKNFPSSSKIDGEWEAIIIKDGIFIKKYPINWIDLGKRDNYLTLKKHKKAILAFEKYISKGII
jgi:hypothetical protein